MSGGAGDQEQRDAGEVPEHFAVGLRHCDRPGTGEQTGHERSLVVAPVDAEHTNVQLGHLGEREPVGLLDVSGQGIDAMPDVHPLEDRVESGGGRSGRAGGP